MVKKEAYLYVILSVVLWGSSASVGKLLLKNLNNIQVSLFISIIAFLTLLIITIFQKKLNLIKKYKTKDYAYFALMGFIGIFLYYVFFYGALMFSSAQEAFIVNYTWPVFIVIFSILFKYETFSFKKILAITLGFIGVFIVITQGSLNINLINNTMGVILAFAGAICYGLFSVITKKKDYERTTSMTLFYLFTSVYFIIAVIFFSTLPKINISETLGLLWLGIFPSGLAFLFWQLALKYGDTAKISNIIFLTPFVSLVYIYFLIGEKIMISSVIGLVIIIFGIILQSYNSKKQKNSSRRQIIA
ncbi:putative transporter in sor 3'region [uncultured archaeon]|nr:putative transporter in sor 3'region [uncultured archaeon]